MAERGSRSVNAQRRGSGRTDKNKMRRGREGKYLDSYHRRQQEIRKHLLMIAGAILLIIYIAVGVYYFFHFYGGTVIGGADCGGMTSAQAKEQIAEKLKEYRLVIEERGGQTEELTAGQINLVFKDDGAIDKMLHGQMMFIWPVMMFMDHENTSTAAFSYDRESVAAAFRQLKCMQAENVSQPKDAYISATDAGYEVVAEEMGNLLDEEKALQAICAALDVGAASVSLDEADCYQKPQLYQNDEGLNSEVNELNKFMGANITWDFGDRQEYVGTEQIKEWLTKKEDGSYSLDENLVAGYVTELANQYDTFGLGREFYTSLGSVVSLHGGDYGWLMDQEKTTQKLIEAINNKFVGVMEPEYTYMAMSRNADDIGNSYVEVCISWQHMWCYIDGNLVVETPVVTGNPNTGHGTPSNGVWAIDSKMRNYTLRGEDYAEPVNYWMAFNEDVGIHDLKTRTEFGGDIYLTSGSHGCVNTPDDAVQIIYDAVSIGMPVVVYD